MRKSIDGSLLLCCAFVAYIELYLEKMNMIVMRSDEFKMAFGERGEQVSRDLFVHNMSKKPEEKKPVKGK